VFAPGVPLASAVKDKGLWHGSWRTRLKELYVGVDISDHSMGLADRQKNPVVLNRTIEIRRPLDRSGE
jgi:hypothetical protein